VTGQDRPVIDGVTATACTIPAGRPEADGTLAWSSATLVIAHVVGGALDPAGGVLRPDRSRPGLGLALKDANAGPYRTA
jgi:hypothetical protein